MFCPLWLARAGCLQGLAETFCHPLASPVRDKKIRKPALHVPHMVSSWVATGLVRVLISRNVLAGPVGRAFDETREVNEKQVITLDPLIIVGPYGTK